MSCVNSKNQLIFQALLDKAASYPFYKPYQAKAYKTAADVVQSLRHSLYESHNGLGGLGDKTHDFIINRVVATRPKIGMCLVAANQPVYDALLEEGGKWVAEPILSYHLNLFDEYARENYANVPSLSDRAEEFIFNYMKERGSVRSYSAVDVAAAMAVARKRAAEYAPKDTSTWPDDSAERSAFQERVAASKVVEAPKPVEPSKPLWSWADYLESMKPKVYTAENPRRSKRLAKKPAVKYFPKEDEVEKVIKGVCAKKELKYSDKLLEEFNNWLPSAGYYEVHRWDNGTSSYIPRDKKEIARDWAEFWSPSLNK